MASSSPSRSLIRPSLAALAGLVVTAGALAQTPPIKPGLWETRSEREVDGKKAPMPSANFDKMSPEVRARVEAAMKERGVALGSGGANRVCLTKETLDPAYWQGLAPNCKTDYVQRSAAAWKWRAVCTQPPSESEGQAVFAGPESYTIDSTTRMTLRGADRVSHMTIKAKWLGADCGDIKPVNLKR